MGKEYEPRFTTSIDRRVVSQDSDRATITGVEIKTELIEPINRLSKAAGTKKPDGMKLDEETVHAAQAFFNDLGYHIHQLFNDKADNLDSIDITLNLKNGAHIGTRCYVNDD